MKITAKAFTIYFFKIIEIYLYFLSKIMGLAAFTYNNKLKLFQASNISICFSVLIFLITFYTSTQANQLFFNSIQDELLKISLTEITTKALQNVEKLQFIGCFVLAIFNYKNNIQILNDIIKCNQIIFKNYSPSYTSMLRYGLVFILKDFIYMWGIFLSSYYAIDRVSNGQMDSWSILFYLLPTLAGLLVSSHFTAVILNTMFLFQVLNIEMGSIILKYHSSLLRNTTGKSFRSCELSHRVDKLALLHTKIVAIVRNLDKNTGPQMLFMLASNYANTLVQGFYILIMLLRLGEIHSNEMGLVYAGFVNISLSLIQIYFHVKTCNFLTVYGKLAVKLLNDTHFLQTDDLILLQSVSMYTILNLLFFNFIIFTIF